MADDASNPPPRAPKERSAGQLVGTVSGVGFEFLIAVLLPGALGYWLDSRWHTGPWLMIAGGAFGFGVGLWRMLKSVNEVMR